MAKNRLLNRQKPYFKCAKKKRRKEKNTCDNRPFFITKQKKKQATLRVE